MGERTRLCLIGDSSSIHVQRWAQRFSKSNEVLVISDSEERISGVMVRTIFNKRKGFRNLLRIPRMRRTVREFAPDLVHGHYLTVGGFYAALAGGKRVVGSAWGSDVYYDPEQSRVSRSVLGFVLKRCDLVFAGSDDMAQALRHRGYQGEVAVVRFGVDSTVFSPARILHGDEFRIFSARHCSRIYNPLVIVEGFRKALPEIPNSFLYLLESGNQISIVHELVESDIELSNHVRFINWLPYEQMPQFYNSVDIVVSIPQSDSVAAAVLESMACETPVVVSDIPNMRIVVEHGVTGFLTRIDANELADRLKTAYRGRSELCKIGRRARQRVLDPAVQGTWDSNMRVADMAYQKLIERIA